MPERRAFSVAIFARHRDRVLLIHHARLKTWLPVGGEIEAGETPLEAARRELKEETGLDGDFRALSGVTGAPPGLLGYEEHLAGSKGLHMNFCFVADVATTRIVPNEEVTEHRWISDGTTIDAPTNVRELVALALRSASSSPAAFASLTALAREWLRAFNARELDGLLALYADDAVHLSPKLRALRPATRGLVRGKAALREWWADSFARLPGLHYAERAMTAAPSSDGDPQSGRVLLEYDRTLPDAETLAVAESFVVRQSRIAESRVYHG